MKCNDIPVHVVIIPDGNRRWARRKMLKPWEGHRKSGAKENLIPLFEEARRLGVKYVSLWGFSTENWKRDKREIDVLFDIMKNGLKNLRDYALEQKIRVMHIGRDDRLPEDLLQELREIVSATKSFEDFRFVLCLDYGGRDELVRAVGKLSGKKNVDEKIFAGVLDTKEIPDPDLIIRTGGEKRLSGFMPFQAVYSELYFTDALFPDFGAIDLRTAIEDYKKRKRNFGR